MNWLAGALHGDFGDSYQYSGVTVAELMAGRLPVTALLALMSLVMIIVIAVPLGILSARFAGRWLDTVINQLSQITMAVPAFFLGIVLTYIFGLILHWFQPGAFVEPGEDFWGCAGFLVFPAIAVALPKLPWSLSSCAIQCLVKCLKIMCARLTVKEIRSTGCFMCIF